MTTATYMIGTDFERKVESLLAQQGFYSLEPVIFEAALFEAQHGHWTAQQTATRYARLFRDRALSDAHNQAMGYD